MRKLLQISVLLISSSLCLTSRSEEPRKSSVITVSGKIVLPATLNPRNIYSQAMLWTPPSEDSCSATIPLNYPAMAVSDVKYEKLFRVGAWPLDPVLDANVAFFNVAADGSFTGSVSATNKGYCFSANADRVILVNCLAQAFSSGKTYTVDLTLESTIKALALFSKGQLTTAGATVDPASLNATISQMTGAIKNPILLSDWSLAGAQAAGTSSSFSSVLSVASKTTPKKYTDADKAPYALNSPSQLLSPTSFNFTISKDANLLTAQTYSSKGVRFAVSPGSKATVTNVKAGVVQIASLKPGESLQLTFTGNNIRSFGFRLANGALPGSSVVRRAFRVRAYDQMGLLVGIPLNWYTNQTGTASFYGLTVNSSNPNVSGDECLRSDAQPALCERPIYRVVISPSESVVATESDYNTLQSTGDPMHLDDLYISTSYSPQPNLGWISDGWELTSTFPGTAPSGIFDHFDRDTQTSPDANCSFQNNWSGKKHWVAKYPSTSPGTWIKKTLTSPGFTLTNFPLDLDDTSSGSKWAKGPTSNPFASLWKKIVRPSGTNSCSENYDNPLDPNSPATWNDPLAPIEWTTVITRCRTGDPFTCTVAPWKTWASQGIWASHWSHVHAQIYYAAERSKDGTVDVASSGEGLRTRVQQEYSTDNGATWRQVFWHPDEDHRGRNGIFYHAHNHPFADSDLGAYLANYKKPWTQASATPKRACNNTDFFKSGWRKTTDPYKKGVYNYDFLTRQADGTYTEGADGLGPRDSGDTSWDGECREWDTEFYQDANVTSPLANLDNCCRMFSSISPTEQSACLTTDANGCYVKSGGTRCGCSDESVVLGTTMRYRFVFETNAAASEVQCYLNDGQVIPCEGVRVDDVALNNDTTDGYYTDFDYFESQNLGSRP